jgi:hypothetical protein
MQEEAAKLHALLHGPPARRASQEQPPTSPTPAKASTTAAAVNPPTASASSSSPAGVQPNCTHPDASHSPSPTEQVGSSTTTSIGLSSSTHVEETTSAPPSKNGNSAPETLNGSQNSPQGDIGDAVVSCSQDDNGHAKPVTHVGNDGSSSYPSSTTTASTTTNIAPTDKAVEQQAASGITTSAGTPPEVVSLINSLFRGQLKSTVTCQACRHASVSYVPAAMLCC